MKHTYLLPALLLLCGISSAQNKTTIIDSILHRTNRAGLFNGNVLVVDNGKIIYRNAIGYNDALKDGMLTEQYRFHIGSIAKEFNAVGIMMLKEQGKLSMDDKVSKYLTGLPKWADKVSISNLLQYTSGVPDVKWKTVKGDADNLADLQKLEKLDFEPGTQYAYNNNNVFLQRRIIEKITGLPFNKFVETRILKPLGMNNSLVDPAESTPLMAKSFDNNNKPGSFFYPITGWVATNLDDFYKWEQALEHFKLISPASTKELLTAFAAGDQCGLGGGSMKGDKLEFHQHDGASVFYQALLTGEPGKGRTVILLTNNKQNNIFDIDNAIQNILNGKPYTQLKRSLLADFRNRIDTLNGEQILALYQSQKQAQPAKYGFDSEATLNEIGYSVMGEKKLDDAILIFEYNTRLFPTSGNAFDSLGEAYNTKGDKEKALLNYKRSLQLDPANTAAKTIIAALEKK